MEPEVKPAAQTSPLTTTKDFPLLPSLSQDVFLERESLSLSMSSQQFVDYEGTKLQLTECTDHDGVGILFFK
jgi:hypothetical protein